jgi:hypothetical protein
MKRRAVNVNRPDHRVLVIQEELEPRRLLSASLSASSTLLWPTKGNLHVAMVQKLNGPKAASTAETEAAVKTVATAAGLQHFPTTSAQFQTALNNAVLGDTIILQAGTTYKGQFTLPNKTTGSGWITIRSSNLHLLPGEGVRVSPADAANMPRLQSPDGQNNTSVIRTAPGTPSHHFQFIGIEFVGPTPTAGNTTPFMTALIELGTDTIAQNTVESVPHHLVFDRCYLRPHAPDLHIRRAFSLNSGATDILNSYIEEIHQPGSDSQAIGGWNGTGPYNIINNRLEGASENIMFGGARGRIPNVVPSDIVIRGNHLIKPLHWRSLNYNVKNLFELKSGARILVEGNIMENNWVQGQTGVAIVLKLGDRDTTPWNVTEDVTLVNNIIRGSNGAVSLQGRDYASGTAADPGGNVRRLTLRNNLFDDINGKWGTSGTGGGTFNIYLTHGPKDITFDHNTFINGYTTMEVDSSNATYPATNFIFTNNVAAHNSYGIRSTSGTGNPTFTAYFNDGTTLQAQARFTRNVLAIGGNPNSYTLRPNNYFPANWDAVQFVDRANGNYRLAPTSPYKNAGTTGKDLGANMDAIDVATAGAISGSWPQALQGIQINNGSAQRSHVKTVNLSFNQPITFAAGTMTVTPRGGSPVQLTATPSADLKNYTLTFSGAGIIAGSLSDGVYDFLANVSNLRDTFGLLPVGTHTDKNPTLAFHRLFGDSDGDKDVDGVDYNLFRTAYRTNTSHAGFIDYFDFDGDGDVDGVDNNAFNERYRLRLTY